MTTANEKEKSKSKSMNLSDVLKLVSRRVPVLKDRKQIMKDGKPQFKEVSISEDEVMNHAVYEDRVVVVTKDGQKFVGELA